MEFLEGAAKLVGQLMVIFGAIGALWVLVKKPWRAISAWFDRMQETMNLVGAINHELGRNSGKSLADEIHRQGAVQIEQGQWLRHAVSCVDALCDVIEKAIFHTNHKGHWVRVNRTFSLTFGYPLESVLGMGWVSAIDPSDRDQFLREWEYAISDRRSFRRQVRIITRDDTKLVALVTMRPQVGNPEVGEIGWLGTIEVVSLGKVQGAQA